MSLIKILPEYLETFTLTLHPNRRFVSSSAEGVTTGSLSLSARPSTSVKSIVKMSTGSDTSGFEGSVFDLSNYYPSNILESVNRDYLDNYRDSSWDGTASYTSNMVAYLSGVHETTGSHRNARTFEITRFDAPFELSKENGVKNFVRNGLMSSYRSRYTGCDFTYTNYSSLNFFTSSDVPSGSALIYPNFSGATPGLLPVGSSEVAERGYGLQQPRPYTPYKGFTLQFYINPRYTTDDPVQHGGASSPTSGSVFRAGTIMHLSSTFAVSLVTGSGVDESGYPNGYRIMLQLSHSCDTKPSDVDLSITNSRRDVPNDLIFLSDDNVLTRNHWHHVSIRWDAATNNRGTGSFYVDGSERGSFAVQSASIAATEPFKSRPSGNDPRITWGSDALVIGNFFEGSHIGQLFNGPATGSEGCARKVFSDGADNPYHSSIDPAVGFHHPLNAEIHEVQIWKRSLANDEVSTLMKKGVGSIDAPWSENNFSTNKASLIAHNDLCFYLPPFFVKESNPRKVTATPFLFSEGTNGFSAVDLDGGQTLGTFSSTTTSQTDTPFHLTASLSVGGHIVSLENYVRDFVTGYYPRLFHLTATIIDTAGFTASPSSYIKLDPDGEKWSANRYFYSQMFGASGSQIAKRNLTILPNDNGKFQPNFDLLETGSGYGLSNEPDSIFKTSLGAIDRSIVSLNEMILTGALGTPPLPGDFDVDDKSFMTDICGAAPSSGSTITPPDSCNISRNYIHYFSVYNQIRDPSSNQLTFFNIPNLYYGQRILPETFKIIDPSMTGSGGKVKITLKDNGKGGLYRADCTGSHPTWSNVGNVFYEEGVAIIKSPNLPLFATGAFETSFQGEQSTHVLTINAPCETGMFMSSSNPSFKVLSASLDPNEYDPEFVYITGFNLHDDNLNVIGRSNLAQPLIKRSSDEFLFKFKMDF